ncbi:MAG: DNA repair protein RadC [Muribaculaceae bacterium]|nr:DNA repair protein RadC [Muribaculaceae bacterium]
MIIKRLDDKVGNPNMVSEPKPTLPKVADMCLDDKPREKAEKYGCSVLSVPDLWAIILRTGSVGYPITQVCRDIMQANNNKLKVLERRTRQELLEVRGLGPMKVTQIEAVLELIRRYNAETPLELPIIHSSADIYNIIKPKIAHLDHEEVWVIIMDRRHRVSKLLQISKGGWASSLFDIKIIIKEALLENASAIALCHNHPSGNMTPSPQDDAITRKCKDACSLMEISLLDHLIVSPHEYYSYCDRGRL